MSVRQSTDVWDGAPYDGTHLLVLLACADVANDEGIFWYSHATMARKCRLSPRRLREILSEFRRAGILLCEARPGKSNIWQLSPTWTLANSRPLANSPQGSAPPTLANSPQGTLANSRPHPGEFSADTLANSPHRTVIEPSDEPSDEPSGEPATFFEMSSAWRQIIQSLPISPNRQDTLRRRFRLERHAEDSSAYRLVCADTHALEIAGRMRDTLTAALRALPTTALDATLDATLEVTR